MNKPRKQIRLKDETLIIMFCKGCAFNKQSTCELTYSKIDGEYEINENCPLEDAEND